MQPERQTGTTVVALLLKSATIRVKSAVRRRVDAVLIIVVFLLLCSAWLCAPLVALPCGTISYCIYVRQTTITITHYSTVIVRSNYYVYSRLVELRTKTTILRTTVP